MTLLSENIQEDLIRAAHRYAKNYENFKEILPEDDFVNLYFSSEKIELNELLEKLNCQCIPMIVSSNNHLDLERIFKEKSNNDINLILVYMIYLINKEESSLDFLIITFGNLFISTMYGFDYFFKAYYFLLQKIRLNSIYKRDQYFEERYFEKFNNEILNDKNLIEILGEDYFKYFFLNYFDEYIERIKFYSNNTELEEKLIPFMQTFDTYKWLDEKRRDCLILLGTVSNIFYQEHCNNLNDELRDTYIRKMVEKSFENKNLIV